MNGLNDKNLCIFFNCLINVCIQFFVSTQLIFFPLFNCFNMTLRHMYVYSKFIFNFKKMVCGLRNKPSNNAFLCEMEEKNSFSGILENDIHFGGKFWQINK